MDISDLNDVEDRLIGAATSVDSSAGLLFIVSMIGAVLAYGGFITGALFLYFIAEGGIGAEQVLSWGYVSVGALIFEYGRHHSACNAAHCERLARQFWSIAGRHEYPSMMSLLLSLSLIIGGGGMLAGWWHQQGYPFIGWAIIVTVCLMVFFVLLTNFMCIKSGRTMLRLREKAKDRAAVDEVFRLAFCQYVADEVKRNVGSKSQNSYAVSTGMMLLGSVTKRGEKWI